jgi:DNA-binding transcriptional LysR family regulator
MSVALARLREHFADPLFVRSGNTMSPTPRGAALALAAGAILEQVHTQLLERTAFDPASSTREVTIALTDVGEVVFLPEILKALRRVSPATTVRSVSRLPEEIASGLETGAIDLAIGYFPDLRKHNFFKQTLFVDSYLSLVRKQHPLARKKLTLRQYLDLQHVRVRAESRHEEVFEQFLVKNGMQRRVALTTPHFASAPMIVAQSDLIVTVPAPLARYFCRVSTDLRTVELPFAPPRIEIRQYWHSRFHSDARNRWLRELVRRLFGA